MGRKRADTVKVTIRMQKSTHDWITSFCARKGLIHGESTPKIGAAIDIFSAGEIVTREDGTEFLIVPIDKDI